MSPLLHNRNKLIPYGVLSLVMLTGLPRDSCVTAFGLAANNNAAQPTSASNVGAANLRICARADCAGKNCAELFAFCESIFVFMSICICSTVPVFSVHISRGTGGAREFHRKIIRVLRYQS
jgi:hypothetical protein